MPSRGFPYQWLLSLFVFALWSFPSCAQEPAFLHFLVEDGLPSNEVYQSIQDDRGYIWLATDRGLVRYDGYEFKVYTKEDGLVNNTVFGFHRDHHRRIWHIANYGAIGYLDNDSIVMPAFNEALGKELISRVVTSMYVDLQDNIWLALKSRTKRVKISPEGEIEAFQESQESALSHLIEIDSGGFIQGMSVRSNFGIEGPNRLQVHGLEKDFRLLLPGKSSRRIVGTSVIRCGTTWYCSQNTGLISFQGDAVEHSVLLPAPATQSLYVDAQQNIWVGMVGEGVWCFPKGDLEARPSQFLPGRSVSSILEDREGGMWFTTLDDGLYYTHGMEIISERVEFQGRFASVAKLAVANNELWIGTKHGQLFSRSLEGNLSPQLRFQDLGIIRGMKNLGNHLVVGIGSTAEMNFQKREELFFLPSNCFETNAALDTIWTSIGDWDAAPPNIIGINSKKGGASNIAEIVQWKNRLLLGGDKGLWQLIPNQEDNLRLHPAPTNVRVSDMVVLGAYLFVGTKEHGLLVHDGTNTWAIDKAQGLPSNYIEALAVQNDSLVWVGTKMGVSKLELSHQHQLARVTHISSGEGLPSIDITDLVYHQNTLWVGSSYGVTYFEADHSFFNPVAPPVFLQELRVNDRFVNWKNGQEFSSEAVAFDFRFVGFNYRSAGKTVYRYRMEGLDDVWTESTNRQIRYMLSPGSYTFKVWASNESGLWSEIPVAYSFVILAPVWQRAWFLVLMALLVVAGSGLLVFWWLKRLRARTALEIGMAQSQNQALVAQLKPHFIFNALNSIHWYIRQNDKEKSSLYIQLFARLIRQILNNSRDPLVTLERELELLENYLKVEQLRFKDRMSYLLEVDPELDREAIHVPTQLIQPYVENAIWHGLMHKEGKGRIEVRLKLNGDKITCVVEDDGIGRQAAAGFQSNSKEHQSAGMGLSQQRLDLLESIYKKTVSVRIIDLLSEDGTPCGTQVELTIPVV